MQIKTIGTLLLSILCFNFFSSTTAFCSETSFFPIEENRTWVYQITRGDNTHDKKMIIKSLPPKRFRGKLAIPLQIDSDGKMSINYMIDDDSGIYEYAHQKTLKGYPQLRETPLFFIRKPIKIGVTWNDTYETRFIMEKSALPVSITITSLDEDVVVPAGTFKNCLKLEKKGHFKKDQGEFYGISEVSVEVCLWYAPGVGLVKSEVRENSNRKMTCSGTETMELRSFHVPPFKN